MSHKNSEQWNPALSRCFGKWKYPSKCILVPQSGPNTQKKTLLHFSLGHDPKCTQSCPGSQIHWEWTHSLGVTSWGLISFLPDNKIIIIKVLADRHWLMKSKINTNCRHIIKKERQYLTLGQTQAKIRSELRTNPNLVMSLMFLLKVPVCNNEKPEI